jgi:glyoxylase-like metal-dependent hydrolase (beta-lactamase superfamily II)
VFISGTALWAAETNAWVIAPEKAGPAVVIDAPPDVEGIAEFLGAHDLAPVALLVSHGHIDHVGGAGGVVRRYSVSAYVHPADEFLYADPAAQLRQLWGFELPGDYAPPDRWETLEPGTVLQFAGIDFDVLHTPGHTPGHCCFHVAAEGAVFSGDQLFAGSIGRTDLPGGDYDTLMASMRDRIVPLDPATDVFPGHGATTTLAAELATNPFLQEFRT